MEIRNTILTPEQCREMKRQRWSGDYSFRMGDSNRDDIVGLVRSLRNEGRITDAEMESCNYRIENNIF